MMKGFVMKMLLADDHTLFREIIVDFILKSYEYSDVVTAKDFHDGKQKIEQCQLFDLVILDLKMPGMNGLEGLQELMTIYDDLPIAIMSGVAKSDMISEALEMGAAGYFPKTLSPQAMMSGIQMILDGEKFIPVDSKKMGLIPAYYDDDAEVCDMGKTTNDIQLTPREKDVLGYLLQGLSNKEIASDLGLQLVTVKLHIRGICRKLDADNRTQAALRAQKLGL